MFIAVGVVRKKFRCLIVDYRIFTEKKKGGFLLFIYSLIIVHTTFDGFSNASNTFFPKV